MRVLLAQGKVLYRHHERTGREEYGNGPIVLYVRDPLTRFVSGFDVFQDVIRGTMGGQDIAYSDINEFVQDFDHAMRDCGETNRLVFRPQVWWDAPLHDDFIRLQSEHMDVSLPQLLAAHGLTGVIPPRDDPSSNTFQGQKSILDASSIAFIREHYAEDFPLWASAKGEYDAP